MKTLLLSLMLTLVGASCAPPDPPRELALLMDCGLTVEQAAATPVFLPADAPPAVIASASNGCRDVLLVAPLVAAERRTAGLRPPRSLAVTRVAALDYHWRPAARAVDPTRDVERRRQLE